MENSGAPPSQFKVAYVLSESFVQKRREKERCNRSAGLRPTRGASTLTGCLEQAMKAKHRPQNRASAAAQLLAVALLACATANAAARRLTAAEAPKELHIVHINGVFAVQWR